MRFKLILFPIFCLLLCAIIGNVETVGNATFTYTYNNTTQEILTLENKTLQNFFPIMLSILIGSVITLGLVFFGSGIRGISIFMAVVFTFFLAIWTILSIFASSIFEIPLIGNVIYLLLTFMYFVGVAGFISPIGEGD